MKTAKRLFSTLLLLCFVLSMSVSASAAGYYINPYEDEDGIDWSRVDTSMMIPGEDYHRSSIPAIMPLSVSERTHFLGWVYNIPKADGSGISISDKSFGDTFTFKDGDTGIVNVEYVQGSVASINVSIFDYTNYEVTDWVTIESGKTKSLYVDLSEYGDHTFKLLISHNGTTNLTNARVGVTIEESA